MPSTTVTAETIGCIKSDYADAAINRGLASGQITNRDLQLVKEYLAEKRATAGIGVTRSNKITYTLMSWRRFIPPFQELNVGSIYSGMEALRSGQSQRGRPFKQNTIADHVVILKGFLFWMIENEYLDIPEKKIRRIKNPPRDTLTKRASDLLTPKEVQDLINACKWSRDRALLMTLYEGGFRVGEIAQLTWGDLKTDAKGIAVNVKFKTAIPRYIRLVMAKEYLAAWRADYPGITTVDSPVFLNEQRRPLTRAGVAMQICRIAKRAQITKKITPHLFRHSRITHLLQEGVPESTVKLMMWGTLSTDMISTYGHLTGRDIDTEIGKFYGLETGTKEEERNRLEPIVCPSCAQIMPPGDDYCRNCMEPLTPDAIAEEAAIQKFVLKNSSTLRRYLDKVEQEQGSQ
jgi:site-specific recombinase XerD